MSTLDQKDPTEIVPVTFQFDAPPTGNVVIEISIAKGRADANTSTMPVGAYQVTGNDVIQLMGAGLDDRDYLLRCTVDQGNERYVNSCILPVRRSAGR